jgi:biotin carboxylase
VARTESISRIVALDEFDMEMAASVREHLRIPGMGETTVRHFRDKLAMRMEAREAGIRVPDFVALINRAQVAMFLEEVPPPWILKPRTSASAIGMKKMHDIDEVWHVLDELENRRSHHLLERFIPGQVLHVDSIAWGREVVFAEASGYLNPPFEVYHGGGLFASATLERDTSFERDLLGMNRNIITSLGQVRGALHTEFIRAEADGQLYFLETAARVGGAHIVDMVEAATGINLWREWARVEVADARGESYVLPPARRDYGGLILSLARQEWPDMSAYADPEIVTKLHKKQHAGMVLSANTRARVEEPLHSYSHRFREDFYASMPPAQSATE